MHLRLNIIMSHITLADITTSANCLDTAAQAV